MAREFDDRDAGKPVMGVDGTRIGTISGVTDGRAQVHVDDESSLTEELKSMLGWSDEDREGPGGDETYDLSHEHVDTVNDEEVRVRGRDR